MHKLKCHAAQVIFLSLFGFSTLVSQFAAPETKAILDANLHHEKTATTTISAPQFDEIASTYHHTILISAPRQIPYDSYITIGGRTIPIYDTGSTADDAGTRVAHYGNKFLYGHNTSAVFGHLAGLSVGTEFSVTLNHQTTNYQIAQKVLFAHEQGSRVLTPIEPAGTAINMNPIIDASYNGVYDLSIMTCAGTPYGGGDASQRLVLFARQA